MGFARAKPAGLRCHHLTSGGRCRVHQSRERLGYGAREGYTCYGAGPRLTSVAQTGAFSTRAELHRAYFAFRELCRGGWVVEGVLEIIAGTEVGAGVAGGGRPSVDNAPLARWQSLHRRLARVCFETTAWDGVDALHCKRDLDVELGRLRRLEHEEGHSGGA